jgi:hypothetical protein
MAERNTEKSILEQYVPYFKQFSAINETEKLDVDNFDTFSPEEYSANLDRLGIDRHSDIVGKDVYYVKPQYGVHSVLEWNPVKGEYLLSLDGQKFWSNPFRILRIDPEKINEDMFNMLDWDFDKFNKKLKSLTEDNSRGMYHFGVDTRHPGETIFYIEDKSNEPGEAGYVAGPHAYKLFRITNDGQLYSYLKYNEMHEGYDWKLGAIYRRISDWLKQLSFDELHQIMETHRRLSPKNS